MILPQQVKNHQAFSLSEKNRGTPCGGNRRTPYLFFVENRYGVPRFHSNVPVNNQYTLYETLEMPLSCGLGVLYNFNLHWLMTADIYYTNWHRFLIRNDSGREMSPVTGQDYSTSDISDTIHLRFGTEYLLQTFNSYAIPFRFGLFYDPAPAENKSDDFYGVSIGTGITRTGQYSMDIAYQYRLGRDVGKSFLKHLEFNEDIVEHSFMISVIFYTGE